MDLYWLSVKFIKCQEHIEKHVEQLVRVSALQPVVLILLIFEIVSTICDDLLFHSTLLKVNH